MSERTDILRGMTRSDGEDLAFLLCAKYLGGGVDRDVFVYRLDESKVVKLAKGDGYQNVIEHAIWSEVQQDKSLSKWFAPVHWISGLHNWLVQSRTRPMQPKDLPKKVPHIFTDLKADNWGWLDGRPVCHDYGSSMCRLVSMLPSSVRKADWNS